MNRPPPPGGHVLVEGWLTAGPDSWEMATVGHPLSDVCNFLTNFYTARRQEEVEQASTSASASASGPSISPHDTSPFLPGRTPGLPTADDVVRWYAEASGYDPRGELTWGMAFSIFKLAAVCQGIAARYAVRQASSEKARQHAEARGPMAEFAWALAKEARREGGVARL